MPSEWKKRLLELPSGYPDKLSHIAPNQAFQFIKLIGAELEGAWSRKCSSHLFEEIAEDSSVRINGESSGHCDCDQDDLDEHGCECGRDDESRKFYVGEIRTLPAATLTELAAEIRRGFPDVINRTCGYHIHTSYKSLLSYTQLSEVVFHQFFLWHIEKLPSVIPLTKQDQAYFWARFEGKNSACTPQFNPVGQLHFGEHRYTAINFAAYHKRIKTVEFRLLPMFEQAETAVSASMYLVRLIETYLAHQARHKEKEIAPRILLKREDTKRARWKHKSSIAMGRVKKKLSLDLWAKALTSSTPTLQQISARYDGLPARTRCIIEYQDVIDLDSHACRLPRWELMQLRAFKRGRSYLESVLPIYKEYLVTGKVVETHKEAEIMLRNLLHVLPSVPLGTR